jgi:hypothetical protein
MRRFPFGAFLSVALLLAGSATAEEIVDQHNDPATTVSYSCGTPPIADAAIRQSFVPTVSPLTAVELRLRIGAQFPADGIETVARIRTGTPTGDVLGETSTLLSGPRTKDEQVMVRFAFDAIEVTPGATYVIEWVTPPSTIVSWSGTGNDPYASGTAYTCIGSVWPGGTTDLNFTTYSETVEEEPAADEEDLCRSLCDKVSRCRGWRRCVIVHLIAACRSMHRGHRTAAFHQLEAFRFKLRMFGRCGDGCNDAEIDADVTALMERLSDRQHRAKRHHRRCR